MVINMRKRALPFPFNSLDGTIFADLHGVLGTGDLSDVHWQQQWRGTGYVSKVMLQRHEQTA